MTARITKAMTTKAKDLRDEICAHCLDEKICPKQAMRLETDAVGEEDCRRRVFIKVFTTSHLGLNITNNGIGKRDSGDQSKFQADLLEISESGHPDEARDIVWCPVTGSYQDELSMTAPHLFSFRQDRTLWISFLGGIPNLNSSPHIKGS